ncbi:MAG TPA: hypothetical protein DDX89_04140 [Candidatus Omnitrophica bacterium]|nr:MAG: hypothetical protein A2105_05890 [Omnitrophica WOR_2 bacterium GWF2_63_9]OGX45266.1 MAG: hypothetical protein A3I71_01555 [Omnitrophica WOR_2 bacterium RIFCSPLOWO2_02_FULL_63_16]OGX49164.1 MAG: hypothetical protein A3G88_04570 [Omnitrophica WOR_2 bacterium RIFCSPLOWO2_12_FULL_63_16]HBH96969.1 hypothetical protein [Candidatus Omnitrophota bacterium]HBQ38277.1 hypothetical protein [Candidatus Omnitrophota bacterium]
MRYQSSPRFDRSIKRLDPAQRRAVQETLERLVAAFETGQVPIGLGLKQLRQGLWECRAGLSDRILFFRHRDAVEFLLAGNHDAITQALRSL